MMFDVYFELYGVWLDILKYRVFEEIFGSIKEICSNFGVYIL